MDNNKKGLFFLEVTPASKVLECMGEHGCGLLFDRPRLTRWSLEDGNKKPTSRLRGWVAASYA